MNMISIDDHQNLIFFICYTTIVSIDLNLMFYVQF